MDPTLLLRRIGYENSIDPRTILIPRVSETDNEADRARAIDTFAVDELYSTYNQLAEAYVEEHEGPLTAGYIKEALTELDLYVNFYNGNELYMNYLLEVLINFFPMEDIVAAVDEVKQETSIIRTRTSAYQIEADIASLKRQRAGIVLAATEYYEKNVAPIERALSSIVPVPILDRSQKYMKTEATVLYYGAPLSLDSLAAMMGTGGINLNDRVFYATRKIDNDNRYLVLEEAAAKLSTELSWVRASREDVLLLLVATPGQKNREVTINSSYSTVSVEDPGDLDLLLAALPGLEVDSRVDTSLSSAVTLEYTDLYPVALYYMLQNYAPWDALMGVDDTQYKKKTISPLILRYNRWPIPGIEEIARETLVVIQVSLSRIAVEGRPVQALVFSVKNATTTMVGRTDYVLTRMITHYKLRLEAIMAIYRDNWPKKVADELLTQTTLGNMRAGRELALLRPEIFGGEYQRTCDKKPSVVTPDEEGATDVDGIYIKCTDARTELGYKPRLDDPTLLVPCCIPTSKRAVINQNTTMLPGQRGYLFGAARLFGVAETQKKGVTQIARVGAQRTLQSTLTLAFREDKAATKALESLVTLRDVTPFKQAMWNYTDEQILTYLGGESWDSDLVADGIALVTRINIFIIEYEDDKMRLRTPRYKFAYYLPFYTDRPSIFIYRHEVRGIVVYENVRLDNKNEYIQKRTVSERSITIFQSQHITELIDRNGTYTKLQDRGPYSGTPLPAQSTQIIDAYGKLRGYVDAKGLAHYYDSPSAPLAGPYLAITEIDETANRKAFSDMVVAGSLTDVKWHNLPIETRLVSLPTSGTIRTPSGTMRVETTWDADRVRDYLRLNRERQFILQLSNWVWSNTVNSLRAIGDTEPVPLGALVSVAPVDYQFDILPQELGVYDTEDALNYLQNTGFSDSDSLSLVAPSEEVRQGILQMLSTAEETRQGDAQVPSRLVGLEVDRITTHLDEGDSVLRSQVYLSSNTSLSRWISSERAFSEASVADLSDPSLRTYPYPFTVVSISKSKGQERWIVQNVQNGSYQRALQCCVTWLHRRSKTGVFNSGFTSEMLGEAERALKYAVIYSWNETGLLTPDVDRTGSSLSLLVYPGYKRSDITITGHFAALLPLASS